MNIQEAVKAIVDYVDEHIDGLGSNQAEKLRDEVERIITEVVRNYI